MRIQAPILLAALCAFPLFAQPPAGTALINQRGALAARPTSCQLAQLYFATDQTAGQNVYGCTTAGGPGVAVWTLQSGGASGPGVSYCAPASASGTTYTCTPSPALTTYAAGTTLGFVPDVTATAGAVTVNVNALGAKSIKESDGTTNPTATDLTAGKSYSLLYDGTVFRINPGNTGAFALQTAVTALCGASLSIPLADVASKSPVWFDPCVLTQNVTITVTPLTVGAHFFVALKQDGTGNWTKTDSSTSPCPLIPDANITTTVEYQVDSGGTLRTLGCTSDANDGQLNLGATPHTALSGKLRCAGVTADLNFECTDSAGSIHGLVNGQNCGATSTCAHTATSALHVVIGSAPLVTGTPSAVTVSGISPAFTSTSSYFCTLSAQSAATGALFSVANVSSSSFTVTGPAAVTTVLNYVCVGN